MVERKIESLLQELKRHDEITYDHSRRVALLSKHIAKMLNYQNFEVLEIERGALLHDIGKLYIPTHILNKHGPLSESERLFMAEHPELGYRKVLEEEVFLSNIAFGVVLNHHNPIKCSSYVTPSMIVHAVDIFDAISCYRPYRDRTFTYEESINTMREIGIDARILNLFEEKENINETRVSKIG